MKSASKLSWTLYHINSLKSSFKAINRWKFLILLFLLVYVLVFSLRCFQSIDKAISLNSIRLVSAEAITISTHLVTLVSIYQYKCAIFTILIVPLWAFVAWLSFVITKLLVEAIFQLFYQEDPVYIKQRTRFLKVVEAKIRRPLSYFTIAFLLIVFLYYIKINIFNLQIASLINTFIVTVLIAIPFIFAIGYYGYYRVYKIPKHRKSSEKYFFSFSAVKRGFKSTVDVLIYLPLLGLLLIPAIVHSVESISEHYAKNLIKKHNYVITYEYLLEKGLIKKDDRTDNFASIVDPNELSKHLSPISKQFMFSEMKSESRKLQNGFFIIVTFGGLISVAFPAIGGVFLCRGRKKAIIKILIASIKTFIIAGALQIFITRTYFIDAGDPIGFAAIFMFILSFFLTLEAYKDPRKK